MFGKKDEETSTTFENRFRNKLAVHLNERNLESAKKNYFDIVQKNISLLKKYQNRAKAMAYFDSMMINKDARLEEIRKHKEAGGKVIGTFCIHVPDELIYAAGAIPLRMSCGFYDSISPAEEIIPKNICPMIKSTVGFNFLKINPLFEFCDVLVIPTSCDGKKKMIDVLSNYHEVWPLELPNNKDNVKGKELWAAELANLKAKLETLTGNKITRKKLEDSIKLLQKRSQAARRLLDIKKNKRVVVSGRDSHLIMRVAFFDDVQRWIDRVNALCDELSQMLSKNETIMPDGSIRIMVVGSPLIFPNMKVLNIIEELGAVAIIDDSCSSTQYFYNPAVLDEYSMKAMMDAIADKYLLPIICPIFVHDDDRVDRILELREQYAIEGVVYHVLRLCNVFDFEFKKVETVVKSKGTPVLKIETEYSEEDTGQIRTRVEAFIEMIKSRRK